MYVLGKLGMGRGVPVSPLHPADEAQMRRIDCFLEYPPDAPARV